MGAILAGMKFFINNYKYAKLRENTLRTPARPEGESGLPIPKAKP